MTGRTAPVLLAAAAAAAAMTPAAAQDPLAALQIARPGVRWDMTTRTVADVDCDGRPDTALAGYEKDAVWLGVVSPDPSVKPRLLRFPVSAGTQDGVCTVPVKLASRPLACATQDGPLPGCKPVRGCRALSMADESCDALHFYWDSAKKALAWWRN